MRTLCHFSGQCFASSALYPEARHLYVWLNTRQAPFNNAKLRQAGNLDAAIPLYGRALLQEGDVDGAEHALQQATRRRRVTRPRALADRGEACR